MTDLYEFEQGYVGRKSYVTVRGHSRSIPKYKTYMGTDRRYYLHPEFGGDWSGLGSGSIFILPDKQEYVSPMDGSRITSRSHHREHMKRHNVIEAGDAPMGHMGNTERSPLSRAGNDIVRAMQELRSR